MTSSIRFSTGVGVLALLSALSASPALAAPTFAIGGHPSVAPGGSFQLSVGASDVTDLYAYQFDVQFDPALFRATAVSAGGFLSTAGATFFDGGSIDNVTGTISFVFESLIGPGSGVTGSGELVQLSFEAIGPRGTQGAFALANVLAVDSTLGDLGVAAIGSAVGIPEPSSLALAMLALGVAGAGGARRAVRGGTRGDLPAA